MEKKESSYFEKAKHLPIRLYTPKETAIMLRCGVQHVYKLCCLGVLKPLKARCVKGRQQKFTRSFFTDQDVKQAFEYRFGLGKQELERLKRGKR